MRWDDLEWYDWCEPSANGRYCTDLHVQGLRKTMKNLSFADCAKECEAVTLQIQVRTHYQLRWCVWLVIPLMINEWDCSTFSLLFFLSYLLHRLSLFINYCFLLSYVICLFRQSTMVVLTCLMNVLQVAYKLLISLFGYILPTSFVIHVYSYQDWCEQWILDDLDVSSHILFYIPEIFLKKLINFSYISLCGLWLYKAKYFHFQSLHLWRPMVKPG